MARVLIFFPIDVNWFLLKKKIVFEPITYGHFFFVFRLVCNRRDSR